MRYSWRMFYSSYTPIKQRERGLLFPLFKETEAQRDFTQMSWFAESLVFLITSSESWMKSGSSFMNCDPSHQKSKWIELMRIFIENSSNLSQEGPNLLMGWGSHLDQMRLEISVSTISLCLCLSSSTQPQSPPLPTPPHPRPPGRRTSLWNPCISHSLAVGWPGMQKGAVACNFPDEMPPVS